MWTKFFIVFGISVTLTHQRSVGEWDELDTGDGDYHNVGSATEISDELTSRECQCNWRLLRHYEAKGCQPAEKDGCGCPLKFDCPNANEINENDKICQYKGSKYAPGALINTINPCESCRCTKGPQTRIVCSSVECLNLNAPLEPGCHFLYEDANQCCPVKIVCDQYGSRADEMEREQPSFTCQYEGRRYPLGARMFSAIDPCRVCLCTEDWDERNSSCHQQDCVLEKYKAKLMDGCVPIYNEHTCCPVEFYCAPDNVFATENEERQTSNMINKADSMCVFGGKFYEIGKSLSINQESTCITCTCQVPPDFTCIHQSCPLNPSEQNCQPYFTSDDCCPKYECLFSDELTEREMEDEGDTFGPSGGENSCLDISCNEGRSCMMYQVLCGNSSCPPVPTCMKTNASCPTPQCENGCVVIEQDANRCPTCVCGEEIEKRAANLVRCIMPQCFGQNCHIIANEEGCPTCSCNSTCPETVCPPGCNVISEVAGHCPKCICEDETVGCPTPLCAHRGCRIENGPHGCPTCICEEMTAHPSENRELEMEGSSSQTRITDYQSPQQQQDFELSQSGTLPLQSQTPDDYDEISIMSRRSTLPEVKSNTDQVNKMNKVSESNVEDETQTKSSLNLEPKPDGKPEP